MQGDRIAVEAREVGSVRGLGVCDVLRVELAPVQRAGLQRRLAERVAALEARRADAGEEGELRLLERMREGVPDGPPAPFAFTGPAGLVVDVVGACLADAVGELQRRLGARVGPGTGLVPQLEAAQAWIATALDCVAVEGFRFEPGVDPAGPW